MILKHVALTCSSEENADRFYRDLLGLEKLNRKTLSAELSRQIFDLDMELPIINYANDQMHFEIFITDTLNVDDRKIAHTCIEVEDLKEFLARCRNIGGTIRQVPKGDKTVTFIADPDGNLFEVT
ncbi:MAG: VOC family protein [Desulfobacterales bacterium]